MSVGGREARATIVTDLGFGDAGKGLLVDHLVRRSGAKLVVRHNGGAQAGHNVVTPNGRHHCFAQFGAGTFVAGTRTHLSRFFVLHPTALLVEARVLAERGVGDALGRVEVDERAQVITPYHQAACRLRELLRGDGRHGSCGVGVGEAVADGLEAGADAVRAADLRDPRRLAGLLVGTRDRLWAQLSAELERATPTEELAAERRVFEDDAVADAWLEAVAVFRRAVSIVDPARLASQLTTGSDVVFEGAQGVLLDQDWGFFPHTTWSRTTSANARALLRDADAPHRVTTLGLTRSYAVRHGAGPLPSEMVELALDAKRERHNPTNAWQGTLRTGALDLPLLRYALEVDGHVDGLVVTHLDALGGRESWPVVTGYTDGETTFTPLKVTTTPTLEGQAELGRRLSRARCHVASLEAAGGSLARALLDRLEELGAPVVGGSRGPTSDEVTPAR